MQALSVLEASHVLGLVCWAVVVSKPCPSRRGMGVLPRLAPVSWVLCCGVCVVSSCCRNCCFVTAVAAAHAFASRSARVRGKGSIFPGGDLLLDSGLFPGVARLPSVWVVECIFNPFRRFVSIVGCVCGGWVGRAGGVGVCCVSVWGVLFCESGRGAALVVACVDELQELVFHCSLGVRTIAQVFDNSYEIVD